MTFSGHIAVGGIVLQVTHNFLLVAVLCLAFHFLTDAIPHVEIRPWKKSSLFARSLMTADILFTGILVFSLYRFTNSYIVASVAIIFSLLPDLTDIVARRYSKPFRSLHLYMHSWPQPPIEPIDWNKTLTGNTPKWIKVSMQFVLIISSLFLTFH